MNLWFLCWCSISKFTLWGILKDNEKLFLISYTLGNGIFLTRKNSHISFESLEKELSLSMTPSYKFPTRNELFGKMDLLSLEIDNLSFHADPSLIEFSIINSQNILSQPHLSLQFKSTQAFFISNNQKLDMDERKGKNRLYYSAGFFFPNKLNIS